MSELRQQVIDAALARGFSLRTDKSYLAAISKTIVIAGVSAMELIRFWLGLACCTAPFSRASGSRPGR